MTSVKHDAYAEAEVVEVAGQSGRTFAALTVSGIGSFALPLGDAILGLIRVTGYKVKVGEIYEDRARRQEVVGDDHRQE